MPTLLGKEVGSTGFGLMGFTWRPNPCPTAQAIKAMQTALARGSNFWNGVEIYGTPDYNSMHLLKRYFTENPADAEKILLSIKGGIRIPEMRPDGSEEGVRRSVDACIDGLGRTKFLDLFECARVDPNTPIETTIGALAEYVKAGKLGGDQFKAAKVHPIAAVEVEFSLWATDILENGIAATCAELDIPVIAHSPLGRGFLTGQIKKPEDIPEDDFRRHMPRFQPEVFDQNLQLVTELEKLATRKGCTPAQLGLEVFDQNLQLVTELEKLATRKGCTPAQVGLAWVNQCSGKKGLPVIIPIPGATTEKRVSENMKDVILTDTELQEIDEILKTAPVIGGRNGGPQAAMMNG